MSAIRIIGNRAFFVVKTWADSEEDYQLCSQPVNPKTGKPWQATKTLQRFTGERAKSKAMWAWCKLK